MRKARHSSQEVATYDYIFDSISKDCQKMFTQQDWAFFCDCSRYDFNKFINKKKRDWRILFIVLERMQKSLTVEFYKYV